MSQNSSSLQLEFTTSFQALQVISGSALYLQGLPATRIRSWVAIRGRRACVWTCIALLALVAAIAPILGNECSGEGARSEVLNGPQDNGVPKAGSHFGMACSTAVLLGVFLDPQGRFDRRNTLHVWTFYYSLAVFAQTFTGVVFKPWQKTLCLYEVDVLRGVVEGMNTVTYCLSQAVLCHIAVLRLRFLGMHTKAVRAARTLKLVGIFGALTTLGNAVREMRMLPGGLLALELAGWVFESYVYLPGISFLLAYVCFQLQTFFSFWGVCREARLEASFSDGEHERALVKRAMTTLFFFAASASTTTFFIIALSASFARPQMPELRLVYEVSVLLDVPFDVGLALVCAGLVGPGGTRSAELLEIRQLAVKSRVRAVKDKLTGFTHTASGPAVVLAALFEGLEPEDLVRNAKNRFRCISWDTLCLRRDIMERGTLDGQETSADLYSLSVPCAIGECDAFLSHSWHDDPESKWDALCQWCESFKDMHQRSPQLWLDKVCINQTQIREDLACLPIFVAGCRRFLVISGPSYTLRLWCCVELFVYVQMCTHADLFEKPSVVVLGDTMAEREAVRAQWQNFDAASCRCHDDRDKARIFSIITTFPGGVEVFNEHVRAMAVEFFASSDSTPSSTPQAHSSSSRSWGDSVNRMSVFLKSSEVLSRFVVSYTLSLGRCSRPPCGTESQPEEAWPRPVYHV